MNKQQSPKFGSLFGFLMVIIGFAVGVGSLWRFPYVMGSQGGSFFLLVYTLLILLIGIPLLTAEMALGYHTRQIGITAYSHIKPKSRWHYWGWLHIAAALTIVAYTVPVYTWILNFLYQTAVGELAQISHSQISLFFEQQAQSPYLVIFAILNWGLLFFVLKRGVQQGIEKASKILMPLLAIIMIGIAAIGLMLPNGTEGLRFIFELKIEKFSLTSIQEALGQALFAIGIGMLGSMVFGAYISGGNKPLFSLSTTICVAIILAGTLAGMMIFPLVFAYGLEPTTGPSLTFETLPLIFQKMPAGQWVGILFYIGFYIAAFTSALGVFEAVIGTLSQFLKVSRNQSMLLVFGIVIPIGLLSIYSSSLFGFLDTLTSQYLIILGALFIALFCGYVWGMDNLFKAANIHHPLIKAWMTISIKWISPLVILLIFVSPWFLQ